VRRDPRNDLRLGSSEIEIDVIALNVRRLAEVMRLEHIQCRLG
jgi:hypothetical protein